MSAVGARLEAAPKIMQFFGEILWWVEIMIIDEFFNFLNVFFDFDRLMDRLSLHLN
jgi:hypothetical protein